MKQIIYANLLAIQCFAGSDMDNGTNAKAKDIQELICLSALHPDQVNPMLTQAAQISISSSKTTLTADQIIESVKKKLLSEEYLQKFAQPFDSIFTHEEVKILLEYYRSSALKKLYKTATETFVPIYSTMQELVSEEVKAIPVTDNVISLNETNYQKEVTDSKGDAILEVYSTFCGPCQAIAPVISELSNELSDKIKFMKLNLNNESKLATELQIHSVPTILFLKDGKIVSRHVGLINKSDLREQISEKLTCTRNLTMNKGDGASNPR